LILNHLLIILINKILKKNIFENLIKNVQKRNGEKSKNSKNNNKNIKRSNIELEHKEILIFIKMRNHFDQNINNNDVVISSDFIAPNDNNNNLFRNSTKNSNENKNKINNLNFQLKITNDTLNLKDINNNLSEDNHSIYNDNICGNENNKIKYYFSPSSMGMNYNYQSDNNPEMNIFPDERDLYI